MKHVLSVALTFVFVAFVSLHVYSRETVGQKKSALRFIEERYIPAALNQHALAYVRDGSVVHITQSYTEKLPVVERAVQEIVTHLRTDAILDLSVGGSVADSDIVVTMYKNSDYDKVFEIHHLLMKNKKYSKTSNINITE